VLNAAYIIHSDEALLATASIFLFATSFTTRTCGRKASRWIRVIFTGSMPLHRLQGRAPFVVPAHGREQDDSEQHFVRRREAQIQVAHVFGFAAVAVGVWLAILIFRGHRERCTALVLVRSGASLRPPGFHAPGGRRQFQVERRGAGLCWRRRMPRLRAKPVSDENSMRSFGVNR